jgi:hypothetical protein
MERTSFQAARDQGRGAVAARIWRGAALRLALAALLVAASAALSIAALGARLVQPDATQAAVVVPPAAPVAGTAASVAESGTATDAARRPALRTDI